MNKMENLGDKLVNGKQGDPLQGESQMEATKREEGEGSQKDRKKGEANVAVKIRGRGRGRGRRRARRRGWIGRVRGRGKRGVRRGRARKNKVKVSEVVDETKEIVENVENDNAAKVQNEQEPSKQIDAEGQTGETLGDKKRENEILAKKKESIKLEIKQKITNFFAEQIRKRNELKLKLESEAQKLLEKQKIEPIQETQKKPTEADTEISNKIQNDTEQAIQQQKQEKTKPIIKLPQPVKTDSPGESSRPVEFEQKTSAEDKEDLNKVEQKGNDENKKESKEETKEESEVQNIDQNNKQEILSSPKENDQKDEEKKLDQNKEKSNEVVGIEEESGVEESQPKRSISLSRSKETGPKKNKNLNVAPENQVRDFYWKFYPLEENRIIQYVSGISD